MGHLTKEKLIARGWTEEQVEYFARKPHAINKKGEGIWEGYFVKKMEEFLSFKTFTTIEEFKKRQEHINSVFEEKTKVGIEHVKSLTVEFENHDCLLKNKDNYDPFKPIFHLVKKDFSPDETGSYSLFTDGCFKSIGKHAFASCAGWILDNNTQEIVIEFTKVVELEKENIKGKGMPEFELTGIFEGVKIIGQLGLKNVQCYTDSTGEANTVLSALHNIGDKRYRSNLKIYEPLVKILRDSNSSIGWIPREYNSHADELTKVPLNAWIDQYNKTYLQEDYIKNNGYVVNREKEIYFHQSKVEYKPSEEIQARYTVVTVYYASEIGKKKIKKMVSMLHDRENDSIELLFQADREHSYIDKSLPEEIKKIKKAKQDGLTLVHLCKAIEMISGFEEINVCAPDGAIAVLKKYTPIPVFLQEEYFELHKLCNEFPGKMIMTTMDNKLHKRINKFLQEELVTTFAQEKKLGT